MRDPRTRRDSVRRWLDEHGVDDVAMLAYADVVAASVLVLAALYLYIHLR